MAQCGRAAGGIAAAKLALSGANPTLGASGENGSWEDGLGPLQMLPRRLSRAPRACVVRRTVKAPPKTGQNARHQAALAGRNWHYAALRGTSLEP